MPAMQIARAKLIPMNGDQVETDESKHIDVQFNPSTLRVTLSNTLKADNKSGSGGSGAAAQYVDKSESTLAVELVFDTSVAAQLGSDTRANRETVAANTDVRTLTKRIAEGFMKPQDADSDRPKAPKRCRFQWGSFQFTGMLSSYSETLDFFAPEGIPLRATLALTFKEDRYQFALDPSVQAAERARPTFAPGGDGQNAASAAQSAGQDPRDWRAVADLNRLDNPRFTPVAGVMISIGGR
ncbi:hypothetical protein [Azoarcus sp. KH32C]|uniref:CIS tube protein n=1 Tax=Azoarcus sp. KH32C TaxID=748247 RepID=UPI0002386330|nr:hypothetical protein [Azoarcus sp. KH32C]BAL26826.1 conserved hypothetical protein [Azoarcus sp. KH32C]